MKTCAEYVDEAKRALGNPRMSDRELGVRLNYSQQSIASGKHGNMSDPMALAIAAVIGEEPGQVLCVARTEREKDPAVKSALINWLKIVASSDLKAAPHEVAGSDGAFLVAKKGSSPRRMLPNT